jgi:hypothetical protein
MRRMKKSRQQSPIWPYLAVLSCLFVLSLAAPRAWQRKAQQIGRTGVEVRDPRPSKKLETEIPAVDESLLENVDQIELVPSPGDLRDLPESEPRGLEPPSGEYADEVRETLESPVLPEAPVAEVPEVCLAPGLDPLATDGPAAASGESASSEPPPLAAPETAPAVEAGEQPPQAETEATVEPEADDAAATLRWPLPRVLLKQLSDLAHEDAYLVWPERAIALIHELCQNNGHGEVSRQTLEQLARIEQGDSLIPAADSSLEGTIVRTRYALRRWLDVWSAAADLEQAPVEERTAETSPARISTCLAEIDKLVAGKPEGAAWRAYLKLDALEAALEDDGTDDERLAAARAVLERMSARRLSGAQRTFVSQGPLEELERELEPWAARQLTADVVLKHVEQFEHSGLPSDAALLADDVRSLNWSGRKPAERLASQLDAHYRNANLRVAVAGELINRLVPQPGRSDAPVRDTVVNVPVRGHSSTLTELSVRLVPDPRRIRFGLEANGVVDSNTVSTSGPATFRNTGQSTFLVRKLFVLGPRGLNVWPAIAEAENNYSYLVGLETDYDRVPLVGSLVRNIARNQHDELRGVARRETEQKVAVRALNELDSEVQKRLVDAGQKLEDNQVARLRRLGLELVPISLATTEERATARARLSSGVQLGAHTPRPRAPSDSWLSLQVHQSALNNGLAQLDLEGQTFELPALFAQLADKLARPDLANQEDLPEDVRMTFADKDAVRVQCTDGRVEVTFALAELRHAGSVWRNFSVRTSYVPKAVGLSPRFVRDPDDTIHLDGRSLRGKIAFKLRAIFSKVLSSNRELKLLDDTLTGDERLRDLQVTQFGVEDGWIALAYSPRRVSSRVATRPEE